MSKAKTKYVCQKCGAEHPKWQGQCNECGEWNSLVEEVETATGPGKTGIEAEVHWSRAELGQFLSTLPEVEAASGSKQRFSSSLGELDRVLGGGIVPGSMVLIGGEPGIGKSTLLTQMVLQVAAGIVETVGRSKLQVNSEPGVTTKKKKNKKSQQAKAADDVRQSADRSIMYVCGEESPAQISLRIRRIIQNEQFLTDAGLDVNSAKLEQVVSQHLQFVTTTDVDQLRAIIAQQRPLLVVVDSIQSISTQDLTGASGSVGQVRESTERLINVGKKYHIPIFLVGHVTKEGVIAGPKVLEHMVDAVLELSGERTGQFRMLRALKNRFGATDEVGVFRFVEYGLQEVTNPSELFLENQVDSVPGSAVTCVMEGTRPLLIEVQALVNSTQLAMPRRVGRGIELSRIQVLAAVLQKHCSLPLGDHDIFLSAAGGFKVKEPAIDLGLTVAIASSLKNKNVSNKAVFIGEVGLLGEVRPVPYLERRIKEAKRLGFEQIISAKQVKSVRQVLKKMKLV